MTNIPNEYNKDYIQNDIISQAKNCTEATKKRDNGNKDNEIKKFRLSIFLEYIQELAKKSVKGLDFIPIREIRSIGQWAKAGDGRKFNYKLVGCGKFSKKKGEAQENWTHVVFNWYKDGKLQEKLSSCLIVGSSFHAQKAAKNFREFVAWWLSTTEKTVAEIAKIMLEKSTIGTKEIKNIAESAATDTEKRLSLARLILRSHAKKCDYDGVWLVTDKASVFAIAVGDDPAVLDRDIKTFFSGSLVDPHNAYVTINILKPESAKKITPSIDKKIAQETKKVSYRTTQGTDIACVCAMVLDFDRRNKIKEGDNVLFASDAELEVMRGEIESIVIPRLQQAGINYNAMVMTGNGYQLWIAFDAQNDVPKASQVVSRFLHGFKSELDGHGDLAIDLDSSLGDPNRIVRIPCTRNIKAGYIEKTAEGRVSRLSEGWAVSDVINDFARIQALAESFPAESTPEFIKDETLPKTKNAAKKYPQSNRNEVLAHIASILDERMIGYTIAGNHLLLDECPVCKGDHYNQKIIVNNEGTIGYACHNPSCECHASRNKGGHWQLFKKAIGITSKQKRKNDDKIEETLETVKDVVNKDTTVPTSPIQATQATQTVLTKRQKVLESALLQAINGKKNAIVNAPTGFGKTTVLSVIASSVTSAKFLFLYPTIKQLNSALEEYQRTGKTDYGKLVSKSKIDIDDSNNEDISQQHQDQDNLENCRVIFAVYSYFLRKGDSPFTYSIGLKILDNRIVIIDEAHSFCDQTAIMYPLFASYVLQQKKKTKQGTYHNTAFCIHRAFRWKCNCRLGCNVVEPSSRQRSPKFKFPETLLETAFDGLDSYDNDIIQGGELLDYESFEYLAGNTFFRELDTFSNAPLPPNKARLLKLLKQAENKDECDNYNATIKHLASCLYNGHIRIELPFNRETGLAINPTDIDKIEDASKIVYPKNACRIPYLCGIDGLPYAQLFKYARQVFFVSATLDDDMQAVITNISTMFGKTTADVKITSPNIKFNITLPKTYRDISSDNLLNATKQIAINTRQNILVSLSKRSTAKAFYEALFAETNLGCKVHFFEGHDFLRDQSVFDNSDQNVLVTYGRSAIMQGTNLPQYTIAIIDCELYIPTIAIGTINATLTKDGIQAIVYKKIERTISQQVGRFFRSSKGNTYLDSDTVIIDPKQLCLVLFNLPIPLATLEIDKSIRNESTYHESIEDWLARDKYIAESFVDTVTRATTQQPLQNWLAIERERIKAIADEKYKTGIENLSHKQRAVLDKDTIEQTKQAEKLETHKQKITELKKSNPKIQWRDIYVRLNLSREDANHRDQLRDFFIKLSLNN